jgi:hypothetical protein
MKTNPKRSMVYGSIGGFIYGCCKTAPDQRHFIDRLKYNEQLVSLVTVSAQNPTTVKYLRELEKHQNDDTLR